MREQPLQSVSLIAGADLSAKQYYAVKLNSSGQAILAGAGEPAVGIIQTPEEAGKIMNVMVQGVSYAIYGGSVTAGDVVTTDANGKIVTAIAGDAPLGYATESGAANEIHGILMINRAAAAVTGLTTSHHVIAIPLELAEITAGGDLVTSLVLGYAGTIKKVMGVVQKAGTGTGAAIALNLEIGSTNLTGGVVSPALATAGTVGAVLAGTEVTANNEFTATDAISVEAAVTTAFTAGRLLLVIVVEEAQAA